MCQWILQHCLSQMFIGLSHMRIMLNFVGCVASLSRYLRFCCFSGWHICSVCRKASHYFCYTCTYSLCKACTKNADYVCVRGSKGFCSTCMKPILLIENKDQANNELVWKLLLYMLILDMFINFLLIVNYFYLYADVIRVLLNSYMNFRIFLSLSACAW